MFKKIIFFLTFSVSSLIYGFEVQNLVPFVDTRIGVHGYGIGNTVIGPQVPNGSINPSPDTPDGGEAGYNYSQPIRGFSQTHVSGTGGGGKYGNFLISFQTGLNVSKTGHDSSKSNEVTGPAYYSVTLTRYNIKVELTPTHHSAIYKVTFPQSNDANIVIDVGNTIPESGYATAGSISIDNVNNKITGWGRYYGGWDPREFNIYFCAKFSKSSAGFGTFKNDTVNSGSNSASVSANGDRIGGYFKYSTQSNEVIYVKIAISMKSVEQAEIFLNNEIPDWNFDKVRTDCETLWNNLLSSILIEGATNDQKKIFYTALYHSFVMPRDRTGDNPKWNSQEPYYDDHYCVWDTWRTVFSLYSLIRESKLRDNVRSFIDRFKNSNNILGDSLIAGNGDGSFFGQGGNNITNIISEAYVKGVSGINWQDAYQVVKYAADNQRSTIYRTRGWINWEADGWSDPQEVKIGRCSYTLEFSYNDFCAAQMAYTLGTSTDYNKYINRCNNWENLYNPNFTSDGYAGFIMGRKLDGTWVTQSNCFWYNAGGNYDPTKFDGVSGCNYYEGNGWTYLYFVPHNFARLIQLHGGADNFATKLNYGFTRGYIEDYNEPGFLSYWAFIYALRPDLCSYWVRQQMNDYTLWSIPQDDDSGAMSAWYVFAAMGLFPNAGQDIYLLHGPLFTKITIQMENGNNFIINGINASSSNLYVQQAVLNGSPLDRAWIRHSEIKNGGTLTFTMGSSASTWGRTAPPPSMQIGTPPSETITVLSPNGGEQWVQGTVQTVTWTWSGTVGNVNIDLSTNNGTSWSNLVSNTQNDGSQAITVPSTPSTSCLVRVAETDGTPSDVSNGTFSIVTAPVPTITVLSPNGGESWTQGTVQTVTWTWSGTVGNVNIDLSTNNGTSWSNLVSNTQNDGSQTVTVPSTPSTSCLVRVSETDGTPSDSSDANFSIVTQQAVPVLRVDKTSLDFGEVEFGRTQTLELSITNAGSGSLTGSISCFDDWVMVVPENFTAPAVINVTVDNEILGMKEGVYTSTITINSNGGSAQVVLELTATCVLVKPNPYNPQNGPLTFFGSGIVPEETKIKIYTLTGNLIWESSENDFNDNEVVWNGKDQNTEKVTPGIYIYTYESLKERGAGKFTVVNK